MPYEEISPLWKLHNHLTLNQAIALIAGYDPEDVYFPRRDYDEFEPKDYDKQKYKEIGAATSLLNNAILERSLNATLRYEVHPYTYAETVGKAPKNRWRWTFKDWKEQTETVEDEAGVSISVRNFPSGDLSTIAREDLIDWLKKRGLNECYFFSEDNNPKAIYEPRYLNPKDSRYPVKLAAAIRAWEAMDDNKLVAGRGVVIALTKWLTANAKQLRLLHEKDVSNRYTKGSLNKTAIDEIAKVANWSGGGPQKLSND